MQCYVCLISTLFITLNFYPIYIFSSTAIDTLWKYVGLLSSTWLPNKHSKCTQNIYDRKFLLECQTSPLTCTPPCLPDIPGVTKPLSNNTATDTAHPKQTPNNHNPPADKIAGKSLRLGVSVCVIKGL
uniref:Uncharacterized protein n=1 Tax=Oncorhynchus mykiss TaxID=8022 RepID=A0A8K9V3H2_ONCMY